MSLIVLCNKTEFLKKKKKILMCDTGNEKESHALWYSMKTSWKWPDEQEKFLCRSHINVHQLNICNSFGCYKQCGQALDERSVHYCSHVTQEWLAKNFHDNVTSTIWYPSSYLDLFGCWYLQHHWEVHQPVAPKYQGQSSCIWWPTWMKHTWSRHAVTSKVVFINPSTVSLKNLFVFIS